MVFVRDTNGVFEAPLSAVWEFVGSGDGHSNAHEHRNASRTIHSEVSGTYAWEQPFDGTPMRFSMRWTSFRPVGLAYEVLEGPFQGSKFFLYYEPRGPRTGVSVVGEFVSPSLGPAEIEPAVERFFALEFEQDSAALRERARSDAPPKKGA